MKANSEEYSMKADSGDPNQTLHSVTSDQGLHYYLQHFIIGPVKQFLP